MPCNDYSMDVACYAYGFSSIMISKKRGLCGGFCKVLCPTAEFVFARIIVTRHHANGGVTAEKRSEVVKTGNFNAGGSTGNVSVSGVGFKPKAVIFFWIASSGSQQVVGYGSMDENGNQWAQASLGGSSSGSGGDATACFVSTDTSGSVNRRAVFVSMDSDGFTINFTAATSNTGIGYIAIA